MLGVVLTVMGMAGHAADLPEPALVVVKTGSLAAELQAGHLWNLQRLVYRAHEVGTATGAYGTVISVPAMGGWVGSGHTQGGVEQIEQIALVVDGEAVDLTDGRTYSGDSIVLTKTSLLDKVRMETRYTFSKGRIVEWVTLTALEDVVVTTVYPFMHCLTTGATQWMAITRDNRELGGEFSDSKRLEWHDDWAWTAAYIPESRTGFVLRHLGSSEDTLIQTGYWDQERYRKLYVSTPPDEQVWRAGRTLQVEVIVTCFEAEPDAWKTAACQVAAELPVE